MPKSQVKLTINLNLLKPQSNPEKFLTKLFRWLLGSGRYIFVFVEAIVLIAFIARFKLDADIAAKKKAIEEQIPYIDSLKAYEILIRQTQIKLGAINSAKTNSLEWSIILKKIADQIPASCKITAINITRNGNTATVRIIGQSQITRDLMSLIAGLKSDPSFSDVNLTNIGLEERIIKFTLEMSAKPMSLGGSV